MSKRVVIDPITRIEGHLRIEVELDANNVINKAWASSTLFRGLEIIMKGRTPYDVGLLMQRICGVCTSSHYLCGTLAVEDAINAQVPINAKYIRSLILTTLQMHDHIVHFYILHGLDWIDVVSALSADPAKAAVEAMKYSATPMAAGEGDLRAAQEKVQGLVNTGKLGPFANAYWGNKTYKFTPEQNLIGLSHYLKALEIQRIAAEAMAVWGGKNPHPQSIVVGGVTCVRDMLDPARLQEFKQKYAHVADFVERVYQADIKMAAAAYAKEPSVLGGCNVDTFMCSESILLNPDDHLFVGGVIRNKDLSKAENIDLNMIEEDVTHSWYDANKPQHPYDGTTIPEHTPFIERDTIVGKRPTINEAGKYSWVKSPRYNGEPVEVGPLATMVVNYAKGNTRVTSVVNEFLQQTGLPAGALFTTLGRTAARMLHTLTISRHGLETFESMVTNLNSDQTTYIEPTIDPKKEYKGVGIIEAPRGFLSHWLRIKDAKVENYQAVVPTTWNAGPIDGNGKVGPYEASLVGLQLEDPKKPLEVLRVIHSFDPCMACSVHVMDYKGQSLSEFRIPAQAM
ncbi:hydrogenase 2 large subunit [Photobacterium phosphoreum]|jgi:quinone-reactive Ni/Fe-hydrogenase large subunit|uniref:Uptake hydrogenase large subunit n=1 Tax=Photobacterium phosphoreum TaxID=659 RepID=A0AAW4ZPB4_PHOPO|nr:nickel-dependent hydrogenase large subunit [Photobacterium phosphoreum]MCD9462754.1 nickel-dependent hydrogenase large subunit [Photobacterium phosphoreum]MCD9478840.1 hydrogenase 2 large subunit [Photobacterium phosphoreum]MCD9482942.1 hydrogenase 2 large subunit [Photobacterium phosphoreum]MCD9489986.1 hydrogenase 2 large subunit [Photobacterium phosphoreum]MCD9501184.1 hydrogenase 2 large subunit [Photobacterium phosphoreum]